MGKVQTGWVNLHSEKFSSNEMGKSRYGLVKPKCEGEISIGIGKSQMGCTSMYVYTPFPCRSTGRIYNRCMYILHIPVGLQVEYIDVCIYSIFLVCPL